MTAIRIGDIYRIGSSFARVEELNVVSAFDRQHKLVGCTKAGRTRSKRFFFATEDEIVHNYELIGHTDLEEVKSNSPRIDKTVQRAIALKERQLLKAQQLVADLQKEIEELCTNR